jgi:hypothetical protein
MMNSEQNLNTNSVPSIASLFKMQKYYTTRKLLETLISLIYERTTFIGLQDIDTGEVYMETPHSWGERDTDKYPLSEKENVECDHYQDGCIPCRYEF